MVGGTKKNIRVLLKKLFFPLDSVYRICSHADAMATGDVDVVENLQAVKDALSLAVRTRNERNSAAEVNETRLVAVSKEI